jgi:hypothetical protein
MKISRILLVAAFMALAVPAFAQEISGNFAGGSIKIGDDTVACGVGRYGAIRYNANKFQGCSTGGWVDIGTFGGGGSSVWVDGGGGKVYYNGGNVGIGTTNPVMKLTIDNGSDNGSTANLRLRSQTTRYRSDIYMQGASGLTLNSYDDTASAHLPLSAYASKYALMDGNVGIGTTNPSHLLTTNGPARIIGGSNHTLTLAASHDLVMETNIANRKVYFGGNGNGYSIQSTEASSGNNLPLTLNPNGGNVGIGTANPQMGLDVPNSGIRAAGIALGKCLSAWGVCSNEYETIQLSPVFNLRINFGSNERFVFTSGGDAFKAGGGSWAASSDARLKNIDGDYDRGLESIIKLNPVRFHYKKDNPRKEPSEKEYVGLIAQDAQKHFPEAVFTSAEDEYLSLDTTPIMFAVINAIKELKSENDKLRADLEAYKASHP